MVTLLRGGGGTTRPLPRDGVAEPNSRATPQGLDHRSRIEKEDPKIYEEVQRQDSRGEGDWSPVEDVHRHYKQNSPSDWSCEDKKIKEDCGHGSKDGKAHSE